MSDRSTPDRFADRHDAGRRLAQTLAERGVDADLVLAIPRGALPLGREVADELGLPLDVVVASKIGAPGNPEYAIGAVGSDGTRWVDDAAIQRHGIDQEYVEGEAEREQQAAREKAATYREDGTEPDVQGESVIVVDDGAATGSTAIAATRLLRERGAKRVLLALPVAPPGTVEDLVHEADDVVCLLVPGTFSAVGQFYDQFGQVSDEEAMAYLQ